MDHKMEERGNGLQTWDLRRSEGGSRETGRRKRERIRDSRIRGNLRLLRGALEGIILVDLIVMCAKIGTTEVLMQDISVIKGELITGTCIAVAAYLIHIGTRIYEKRRKK